MRTSGLGLLVTVALLVCSCGLVEREGSLIVYARNESSGALGYRLDSSAGGGWSRIEASGGCADVGLPWTISVGAAGRDGQVGDYQQLLSSADVSDPTDAEIWIDVAEDGSVNWGQGRPAWDQIGPLDCGPSD